MSIFLYSISRFSPCLIAYLVNIIILHSSINSVNHEPKPQKGNSFQKCILNFTLQHTSSRRPQYHISDKKKKKKERKRKGKHDCISSTQRSKRQNVCTHSGQRRCLLTPPRSSLHTHIKAIAKALTSKRRGRTRRTHRRGPTKKYPFYPQYKKTLFFFRCPKTTP